MNKEKAKYDEWKTTDTEAEKHAETSAKRGGYIDIQISDLKESGECDGLNMVDVFESLLNHEDLRAQDKHHINLCLFAIYRTFPSMSDLVEKHMLKVVGEEFTKEG